MAVPAFDDVAVGTELPAQTFPIRRVDLVRYAGASGDFNVIHWNERVATSVGLPDVIAHGMFTMAHRGAGRDRLGRRPGRGRRVRRAVHPAGAGARRRRRAPTVEVTGSVAALLEDKRVRVDLTARARRRRRCSAGRRQSSSSRDARARAVRSVPRCRRLDDPAPRRAGAAAGRRRDRRRGRSRRCVPSTPGRGAAAGPRRRQQPRGRRRRLRRRRSCRSRPAVWRAAPRRRARAAPSRPGTTGTTRSRSRSQEGYAGHRGPLRHPGLVGATPIQNVGAYGQEVAQTVAWVRVLRPRRPVTCVLLDTRTAGSPTGTACSRAPTAASCSTVDLPARSALAPRRAGPLRRARPAPRRRPWASASRRPTSGRRCSTCAGPRAWCSTRPTTTRGAPARSSPTPSCPPRTPAGCSPTSAALAGRATAGSRSRPPG